MWLVFFILCIVIPKWEFILCYIKSKAKIRAMEVALCVLWRHRTTACNAVGWKTLHSGIHQLPTNRDHQLPWEFRSSVICHRFAAFYCAVNSRDECWCHFISGKWHSVYLIMSDLILALDLVPSHWSTLVLLKDRESTYMLCEMADGCIDQREGTWGLALFSDCRLEKRN